MRKDDSGWRDDSLNRWHVDHGFPCPAAGMALPMIEYDRGLAVGLVNYVRRGDVLPSGREAVAAHYAFSRACGPGNGGQLPFLTAVYDPRNWAMKLFPHNAAAAALVRRVADNTGGDGWAPMTEAQFAELLYAMRGRLVPDMYGLGVNWSEAQWSSLDPFGERPELDFPCQDMSEQRRLYEPAAAAPMRFKVPCLDVDLAVVDQDDQLALVVDYKRMGAACDTSGTNAQALASLQRDSGVAVPAFMTRYFGSLASGYGFETYPLNKTAAVHLAYVLGGVDAPSAALAAAVSGDSWVRLTEPQWLEVLKVAKHL